MYKIVNDDWQQSEPQIFGSFMDAFAFHQKQTDGLSNIYYITEEENTKVWDPRWSLMCPELEANLDNVYKTIEDITNGRK